MRESSSRFLLTLNFYANFRHLGQNPKQIIEAMANGSDLLDASKNQLAALSAKSEQDVAKDLQKTDKALNIAAPILSAIPVIGGYLNLAVKGCAYVIGVLGKFFNVPADKYNFLKSNASNLRRACIGLSPPGAGSTKLDRGNFYYVGYKGLLAMFLHDGYTIPVPGLADPELMTGRILGVVAKGRKVGKDSWKSYRKLWGPPGLPDAQWNKRAANVNYVLAWLDSKFTDKQLKVLDDILASSGPGDARRRGSLYYASMLYIANDLFDACKAIGWAAAAQKIRNLQGGKPSKAADVVQSYATKPSTKDPAIRGVEIVLKNLTFDGAFAVLGELAKDLPATAFKIFAKPVAPQLPPQQKAQVMQTAVRQAVPAVRAAVMAVQPKTVQQSAHAAPPPERQIPDMIAPATQAQAAQTAATVQALVKPPMTTEKKLLIAGGATVAGVSLLAWALQAASLLKK